MIKFQDQLLSRKGMDLQSKRKQNLNLALHLVAIPQDDMQKTWIQLITPFFLSNFV